jgi:hypothetical protein
MRADGRRRVWRRRYNNGRCRFARPPYGIERAITGDLPDRQSRDGCFARGLKIPIQNRLRANRNFLKAFKLISPVQSSLEKYSASHHPQIDGFISPSRLDQRGVRVVTNVEAGCGGRGSVRRFCARRLAPTRTAKPCGPGAPTLALSLQCPTSLAGDGGKKARFTEESTE